jgi:DNA replication protein DnaC
MTGIRRGIVSGAKDAAVNERLSDDFAGYNAKIAGVLRKNGLAEDVLSPVYTCPVCRDEGYVLEPARHMCECFSSQLNHRVMQEIGLFGSHPKTFETFNENLFSTDPVSPYGVSQRQIAIRNRNICREYADSFPDTSTRDMLFVGQSGLGKTYLLQAIAHRVAERGFIPQYISAYRWFENARRSYFENEPEQMSGIMNAQLLLIDDLGTEPLMANITVTQLFVLLNERQIAGRHTVISTNLEIPELRERYTERVTSRLLDNTGCKKLVFIGGDVRERLGKGDGSA